MELRSPFIKKIDNDSDIHNETELIPSDAGVYDLNYKTYPRPEKRTGIQGNLRSTLEIPAVFRHIFSQYTTFNHIQSNIFDDVYYSDVPLIVSAPTGSGKTVIFELAIIRSLMILEDWKIKHFKIIYLAPTKSLCHERLVDWQMKFNHLGVSCIEATGDHDVCDLSELVKYKIIITTPEKWDTLTRRWKDFQDFVSEIKLFLIDEIHLVNENERGATLEVILSRMKTISSTITSSSLSNCNISLRFVAVSATLPNIEDVAVWIGGVQAKFYKMPEEMRPIQLEKLVFGYPSNSFISYFRFDMSLNYKLGQLIQQYSGGKPTLVFCSTRKGVEMAANVLASTYSFITSRNSCNISEMVERISDSKLVKLLSKGIAYHHGGMSTTDRVLIEDSFRSGNIQVLLCTSTLATGVNLPAHLVILKSTQTYCQTGTNEYPENLIFQMIGRAGRPQYDNSGIAIIMTQTNKVKTYENMVSGVRPIESNLHKHLPEHLNAEIVLRTITDLGIAVQWIKSTFLYVRAIKNPSHYGFAAELNKERVEQKLEELCLIAINSLEKHELIIKDQLYGLTITSTVSGKLMARCYLNFNTMKIFKKMTGYDGLNDLILLISNCHEFSDYKLRTSDKRYLNELNNSKTTPLRFPIKGKVKTISDKILILLQAVLGNISCTDASLYQETTKIIRIAEKIAKAMVQYISLSEHHLRSNQFKSVYSALILSKCCTAKIWENSPFVSKQLNKIGNTYSKLLVQAGKTTFESIYDSSARELEMILHKPPPFGNLIHEAISKLPYFNIDLLLINPQLCRVKIRQTNTNCLMNQNYYEKIAVIVGDSMNNMLYLKENIFFFLLNNKEFEQNIKIIDPNVETITAHVIHSNLVGLDKCVQLLLKVSPSESQEAFKSKPTMFKKSDTKNTLPLVVLKPAPLQSIKPNVTSSKYEDNHNNERQHHDDYFDIEISQHQMIFNKSRDQGIDHDQNKNLINSNFVNNSNITLVNDDSTSSAAMSLSRKFIKKTRVSKNDFTTIIVPSESQKEISTQQEIKNTSVPTNDDNRTYRIIEILENGIDSNQSSQFNNKCLNSNTRNVVDDLLLTHYAHKKQINTADENSSEESIKIDINEEKNDSNQEQNLNISYAELAGSEYENKLDVCNNKLTDNSSEAPQLKIYNCYSIKNRAVFPTTPKICKKQRGITNKPTNYLNLLRSICDRDAFSEGTNITFSELLNEAIAEDNVALNEDPKIDYKFFLSQQNFMSEQKSPLTIPKEYINLNVGQNCLKSDKRPESFREKLNSYEYEKTKKPKLDKPNCSIFNFIDNSGARNISPKFNEYTCNKSNCISLGNTASVQASGQYLSTNKHELAMKNTPSPQEKDNDDIYETPKNQKYRPFSSSPTLTTWQDGNNSCFETSESSIESLLNTTNTEDNEFYSFFNRTPSRPLFSQTSLSEI